MAIPFQVPPTWKHLCLTLQTFLIFLAPLRKRVSSAWVILPLWSAYLLADWVAVFAIGLISSNQINFTIPTKQSNLLAFWAPFLLVHLGGPDTITAFSLEDNELWLRHLLGLVFQCLCALYVFIQSLPKNNFWLATIFMFLAGIIKYAERTRSLYHASMESFRNSMLVEPEPGPNNIKLMDEFNLKQKANIPTQLVTSENGMKPKQTTIEEYNQTAKEAFRVVEVELNFIYESLYTKVPFLSFISTVVTLILFYLTNKEMINKFEVGLTYALLWGAITLDIMAFIMFLYSDWTTVALNTWDHPPRFIELLKKCFICKMNRFVKDSERSPNQPLLVHLKKLMHKRWSEYAPQYNLLHNCLHQRSKHWDKFITHLGLRKIFNILDYVTTKPFNGDLRNFIFEQLKMKSQMADDLEAAEEIYAAKGECILQMNNWYETFSSCIVDVDYDESLLIWHVATDICYNTDNEKKDNNIAKLLSDYMLYLLVVKPGMMPAAAGFGQTRFWDTCAEFKKFFREANIIPKKRMPFLRIWKKGQHSDDNLTKRACEDILSVYNKVKSITVKGGRKSILLDASILAKELEKEDRK
ncbi:hypothetical protein NMG60_11022342 [Bertholletia excelsa]